MDPDDTRPDARHRAQALVKFWHQRNWLTVPSSLHLHPLDLDKLEELIAQALAAEDPMR